MAKFLEKNLNDEQITSLVKHLSFDEMKDNPSVNFESARKTEFFDAPNRKFIRRGQIGDWKNHFTDEMDVEMNEAIEKHFNVIGLHFRYE